MQLLADGIVRDRYEVVVGSGIGGLTAAAMLAKKGIQVLVLEQHYIPGGCCTCIRRNDITFDVGAAVFVGCGEVGFPPHHFVMNELEEELDLIRHEAMYRLHAYGSKVSFWRDLDHYLDELISMFPKEEKGIRALYDEMKEYGQGLFRIAPRFQLKDLEKLFRVKVLAMLLRKRKITQEFIRMLDGWRHSGFNVFAGRRIQPREKSSLLKQFYERNPSCPPGIRCTMTTTGC